MTATMDEQSLHRNIPERLHTLRIGHIAKCQHICALYPKATHWPAVDPMYGPAVRRKRYSSRRWTAVLHQCIRPLIGARDAPGHHGYQRACDLVYRIGLEWAVWVTSVRL